MKAPESHDPAQTNAAVLLWQTRFRLLLIIAVGGITMGLKLAGKLSSPSVIDDRFGAQVADAWTIAVGLGYFAFVAGLALYLRRHGRIGRWAVVATLIADVLAFNAAVLLATPPDWYDRALILSAFSLQLTLLYFGWRAVMLDLLFVVVAYVGILFAADGMGGQVQMDEALWTLGVFTLGTTAFVMLHADLSARLSMIVRVFDRAREGVFSLSFDEASGVEPDGMTVIGTAYDKMRKELMSLILTDPLTQCFNPRGFDQLSAREVARAARANAGLALLALDLDHFKSVNDTYGHLVGDNVLREVGALLRQVGRLTDVLARTGGEEFTILAPDTNEDGAAHFAQRLLEASRAHRFESLGDRRVTFSIGVSYSPARTKDVMQQLRARADEALYQAKREGRDRAVAWAAGGQVRASSGVTP